MSQTQTKSRITTLGRVIVPVRDQDKAHAFYTGTLGFEERMDVSYGDGDRWLEVGPPGAHTGIALVPPREDCANDPAAIGVDTRIALETDDIDALHADLKGHGVDVDDEVMRMGGPVPPMFFLRDQDGNSLLVVQPE